MQRTIMNIKGRDRGMPWFELSDAGIAYHLANSRIYSDEMTEDCSTWIFDYRAGDTRRPGGIVQIPLDLIPFS